jgi:hypothetical protein
MRCFAFQFLFLSANIGFGSWRSLNFQRVGGLLLAVMGTYDEDLDFSMDPLKGVEFWNEAVGNGVLKVLFPLLCHLMGLLGGVSSLPSDFYFGDIAANPQQRRVW